MDKFMEWVLTIPGMLICGGVLLLLIAIIILIFTSVKSKKGDVEEKPKKEFVYTVQEYDNPLRFYKQDGSQYHVTVADPDIYRDDETGYFYMYCTNTQCEMGDKGMQYDRGPIFRSENRWTNGYSIRAVTK